MTSKPHKSSLIIIGGGMAAGRLLDELLAHGAGERLGITVVAEEPQGCYNRILLSPLLAGEASTESIIQKTPRWHRSHGIRWINSRALRIDRRRRRVSCASNIELLYDHLVVATGSRPARIPARRQDLAGIFAFRSMADAGAIEERLPGVRRAVVVGGGLLGLETAHALASRGLSVTVVHRNAWLMNRQLDRTAGELLREALEERGIQVLLNREVGSFKPGSEGRLAAAELSGGIIAPCELAVVATGITPNAELGLEAGLKGARAIRVDDYMQTSDPAISALGECVEHQGQTFGLVEPIWRQCATLGARLAGREPLPFRPQVQAARLKVSGIELFSLGALEGTPGTRVVEMLDARKRVYRKLLLQGGRLRGAMLFGDVRGGPEYLRLMQADAACAEELPRLLLTGAAFPAAAQPLRQAG